MVEIWEENPTDQNVTNIINCLNDKKGANTVFLVLNNSDLSMDLFSLAKQVIEVNWPTNVVLLWLKTVSKLPDELKENIAPIGDLKAAVLNRKREIKSLIKKTDIVDAAKIDSSLFVQG